MPRHFIAVVAIAAVAAFAAAASAQHDHAAMPGMDYNKATEATVTGTVDNIMEVPGEHAMSGTHLVLSTDKGEVHVHVGPGTYLISKKASFKKGDKVEIVGSRVKGEGFEAVLARQIKKGAQTVVLRDEAGKPLWRQ